MLARRPTAPSCRPTGATSPSAPSSATAADIVGFDSASSAPSRGRVIGPCVASARNTARELSVSAAGSGDGLAEDRMERRA